MKVKVLVCRADGSCTTEVRELPDNWFDTVESQEEPESREDQEA